MGIPILEALNLVEACGEKELGKWILEEREAVHHSIPDNE